MTEQTGMTDPLPNQPTTLDRTSSNAPIRLRSRRFIGAVVTLCGMQLLASMNATIAAIALPKIQDDLNLSDASRSWVLTAYVLAFGGLMLVGGRVGDTVGRKRAFITGVTLFTAASTVCGLAPNGGVLIGARLVQGVAGAIIAPTAVALVATTFPKGPARNTAVGVLGATGSISSVLS